MPSSAATGPRVSELVARRAAQLLGRLRHETPPKRPQKHVKTDPIPDITMIPAPPSPDGMPTAARAGRAEAVASMESAVSVGSRLRSASAKSDRSACPTPVTVIDEMKDVFVGPLKPVSAWAVDRKWNKSLYPPEIDRNLKMIASEARRVKTTLKEIRLSDLKAFHGLPQLVEGICKRNPHKLTYLQFHPKDGSVTGFVPTPALDILYGGLNGKKFQKEATRKMGVSLGTLSKLPEPDPDKLLAFGQQVNCKVWSDFEVPKGPEDGKGPNAGVEINDGLPVRIFFDTKEVPPGRAMDFIFTDPGLQNVKPSPDNVFDGAAAPPEGPVTPADLASVASQQEAKQQPGLLLADGTRMQLKKGGPPEGRAAGPGELYESPFKAIVSSRSRRDPDYVRRLREFPTRCKRWPTVDDSPYVTTQQTPLANGLMTNAQGLRSHLVGAPLIGNRPFVDTAKKAAKRGHRDGHKSDKRQKSRSRSRSRSRSGTPTPGASREVIDGKEVFVSRPGPPRQTDRAESSVATTPPPQKPAPFRFRRPEKGLLTGSPIFPAEQRTTAGRPNAMQYRPTAPVTPPRDAKARSAARRSPLRSPMRSPMRSPNRSPNRSPYSATPERRSLAPVRGYGSTERPSTPTRCTAVTNQFFHPAGTAATPLTARNDGRQTPLRIRQVSQEHQTSAKARLEQARKKLNKFL